MVPARGSIEKRLLGSYGRGQICGVDEVGRGSIAGPVHAAVCALDYEKLFKLKAAERELIRDSKALSHLQRQKALETIAKISLKQNIASASVMEIEILGIVPATFLAMRRAIAPFQDGLKLVLIDGKFKIPELALEQEAIIKGDSLCYAIAAASILAKEARDFYMREQEHSFPGYGFASHVGYGTAFHKEALSKLGPCPLHRRNFAPVSQSVLQ